MQIKPSIVFVHGIWGRRLVLQQGDPRASGGGYEVMASQHSLDTLEGDVRHRHRTLGACQRPGHPRRHSYGGTLITPREPTTESPGWSTSRRSPPTRARRRRASRTSSRSPMSSLTSQSLTGVSGCSRKASRPSRRTCPSKEQKLVWATHVRAGRGPVQPEGCRHCWRSKPSWYIVANNDRTVRPELQRFVAKRMGATIYEVDSSHVPCCPTRAA
jgi:hypothetical protein